MKSLIVAFQLRIFWKQPLYLHEVEVWTISIFVVYAFQEVFFERQEVDLSLNTYEVR